MIPLTTMSCPACKQDYGKNFTECEECRLYLNWIRLSAAPMLDMDVRENQQSAGHHFQEYDISKLSLQEHFLFLKRLESITAFCSLAYNQRTIKERIPDIDKVEKSKEWSAALTAQKLANTPAPVRKSMDARDKAIAGLMACGISRKDAEDSVDAQRAKMGQTVGDGFRKD